MTDTYSNIQTSTTEDVALAQLVIVTVGDTVQVVHHPANRRVREQLDDLAAALSDHDTGTASLRLA